MNYELAKKLKDAGFPQDKYSDGITEIRTNVYSPTLSELIEACGQIFNSLTFFIEEEPSPAPHWEAYACGIRYYGEGMTPEEAVSNLWLELNKKV